MRGHTRAQCVALYKKGLSCAKVADVLGVNAKTVLMHLYGAGVKLRQRPPRPYVEYRGVRYYRRKDGYYVSHTSKRSGDYLHRVVWEANYKRKIPRGHQIHHKDGNKENNRASNLLCLSTQEHARLHRRRDF